MSAEGVRVRPAVAEDLPWVADLVRDSFDDALLPYLIAAQPGIVSWWSTVVEHPGSFPTTRFSIAVDGDGGRLGYAELKESGERTGFLSYVAVSHAARGQGVARRLIADYLRDERHLEAMELDVFESNQPARRLYDRLGFEETSRTTWWGAPLEVDAPRADLPVADLHAVLARHRAYGFTDLVVDPGGRAVRFGVMGDDVLRCFSVDAFSDLAAQAVVRDVFPRLSRRFAVLPGDVDLPGARPLVQSLRLRSHHVAELLEDA
nr:GNAT family N-acetyltransferase [uncultured Nocardioides sp.]